MSKKIVTTDTAWDNKEFPDAVDSKDVAWMMVEWRIQRDNNRCSDCGGNYTIYPNQFDDMPLGTTKEQAVKLLRKYKKNRRENISTDPDAPVRTSLFLLKVVKVVDITDDNRNLLPDIEVDIDG